MAGAVSNKLFSGALFFTGKSGFFSGILLFPASGTVTGDTDAEYLNISFKSALIRIR
ncbi:hypothetical protein D3C78_1692850 [compost metagenome]